MDGGEVRRCAACGEPAMVAVRVWGTRRMLGLVSTGETSRVDLRCQACGAAVTFMPAPRVRAVVGSLIFGQLGAIGLFVMLGGVASVGETPALGLGLLATGGCLAAVSALAVRTFVRPWWSERSNPVVPGAPRPVVRYDAAEPARRCGCGEVAPVTEVIAHSTNFVPTGTDTTHACPACGARFTVSDDWGIAFNALVAAVFVPLAALAVEYPPGSADGWDWGDGLLVAGLVAAALGAVVMLGLAIVARARHPVARR